MSETPKKPTSIAKAIAKGDSKYLSNAGRKGAEVANKNRDIRKTLDEIEAEELKLMMLEGAEEAYQQRGGDPDDDYYDEYRIGPRL